MTWEEISKELFGKRTAKRWEIIDEEFISYTGGTAQLISNGECEIHLWEPPKDAQLFCDKLNAINEENEQLKQQVEDCEFAHRTEMAHHRVIEKDLKKENEKLNVSRDELINENRHIKNTIQTMLINERTRLGKSVLKQLWEAIQ